MFRHVVRWVTRADAREQKAAAQAEAEAAIQAAEARRLATEREQAERAQEAESARRLGELVARQDAVDKSSLPLVAFKTRDGKTEYYTRHEDWQTMWQDESITELSVCNFRGLPIGNGEQTVLVKKLNFFSIRPVDIPSVAADVLPSPTQAPAQKQSSRRKR